MSVRLVLLSLALTTPLAAQETTPSSTPTPTPTPMTTPMTTTTTPDPAAAPADPLLQPPAAPTKTLSSWHEAQALLEQNSTDLQAAVAEVDRAEGRARQSLAALLPSARLQGGVGYDIVNPKVPALGILGAGGAAIAVAGGGVAPTVPVGAAAVSATVPVVDLGAWSGLGAADDGVAAARFSVDDARRRLTQSLARSLVSVVGAEHAVVLNREGLRQALERAALVDRQLALGAAARLDSVRVQQDVELSRAAVVAGDEQLHRAREALAQLLGQVGEVSVVDGFALGGLVDDVTARCVAVATRDDVNAADARVTQAQQLRQQALWGYAPRLDLATSAAALTTTPGPAHLGTWSIGAVLSIPIWEGGLREGLVAERDAAARVADSAKEAAERAVAVDVARAVRNEGTAQHLAASAKASRDLAVEADALTKKAFALGRVSSLDVVAAAQALRAAELNLAWRDYEWAQARLDALLSLSRCSP